MNREEFKLFMRQELATVRYQLGLLQQARSLVKEGGGGDHPAETPQPVDSIIEGVARQADELELAMEMEFLTFKSATTTTNCQTTSHRIM